MPVALSPAAVGPASMDTSGDPTWVPPPRGRRMPGRGTPSSAPLVLSAASLVSGAVLLRLQIRLCDPLYLSRVRAAVAAFRRSALPRLLFCRRFLRHVGPRHWHLLHLVLHFVRAATQEGVSDAAELDARFVAGGVPGLCPPGRWSGRASLSSSLHAGSASPHLVYLAEVVSTALQEFTSETDCFVLRQLNAAVELLGCSALLPLAVLPRPLTVRGFRLFAPTLLNVVAAYFWASSAISVRAPLPRRGVLRTLYRFTAREMEVVGVSPSLLSACSGVVVTPLPEAATTQRTGSLAGAAPPPTPRRRRRRLRRRSQHRAARTRTVSLHRVASGGTFRSVLRVSFAA